MKRMWWRGKRRGNYYILKYPGRCLLKYVGRCRVIVGTFGSSKQFEPRTCHLPGRAGVTVELKVQHSSAWGKNGEIGTLAGLGSSGVRSQPRDSSTFEGPTSKLP